MQKDFPQNSRWVWTCWCSFLTMETKMSTTRFDNRRWSLCSECSWNVPVVMNGSDSHNLLLCSACEKGKLRKMSSSNCLVICRSSRKLLKTSHLSLILFCRGTSLDAELSDPDSPAVTQCEGHSSGYVKLTVKVQLFFWRVTKDNGI